MKILRLPSYFEPENAASSYLWENLSEAFAKEGMDMQVFVPFPTRGISRGVRDSFRGREREILYDGHLKVYRFPLFGESCNPIMRAFRYLLQNLLQFCYSVFSKDAEDANVIFVPSTPPTQCAMAVFVKKVKKIPLVYTLQDIFPDSLVSTGYGKKNGILWNIGRVIEDFTYRNSDKIVVISEDFKKNLMTKGVSEDKIVVVYNWVDQNAVVDIAREKNKLFDAYNLDRTKFYIEYSGNIGLTQNMDMLLEIMAELQVSHPNIRLALVGEGAYKVQVEKIIAYKQLKNVVILPLQPYKDISHVFSLGDAGLVISKPGVGANSVPSKTWSIMSASRPVLANFDENELKSILTDNECGIFTKAGDKEAFKQSIITLYENLNLCKKYGENGRKFVMTNLTREVGTNKYVEVIKSVVENAKKNKKMYLN